MAERERGGGVTLPLCLCGCGLPVSEKRFKFIRDHHKRKHDPNSPEKVCFKCQTRKPKTEFSRHIRSIDGYHSQCKQCRNFFSRLRWYGTNADRVIKLILWQHGVCAICKRRKLQVFDHSHTTGWFRGILCQSCNLLIGHAREDIEVLKAAIEYLQRCQDEEEFTAWVQRQSPLTPQWVYDMVYGSDNE